MSVRAAILATMLPCLASSALAGPPTAKEAEYVQALGTVGKVTGACFEELDRSGGRNSLLASLCASSAACHAEEMESWELPDETVRGFRDAMVELLGEARAFYDALAHGEVGRASDLGEATKQAQVRVQEEWKRLAARYEQKGE